MSTNEKHLYYLNELKDYKINSKDPDIRGWTVKDLDNRVIGRVDNLLVNKDFGKVVYIDVEVDQSIIDKNHDPYKPNSNSEVREFINKEGETHIIIPIGLVDLNPETKNVYTESINYQTFAETKRYKPGTHISRDYEHHVLDSYDRDHSNRETEIHRTRTAYSETEPNENIGRHEHNSKSDVEERIQREKENLRYKSEGHNRPVDDHNRASHHHDTSKNLQPERTLDDDSNWVRDDREIDNENTYTERRQRNRSNENFYDRREFNKRNDR